MLRESEKGTVAIAIGLVGLLLVAAAMVSMAGTGVMPVVPEEDAKTPDADIENIPEGAAVCQDPRPMICTADYRPVCGSDGQTHGNGCSACGSEAVAWHVPGECVADKADAVVCQGPKPTGPVACTREYMPVCGSDGQTYGNKCGACAWRGGDTPQPTPCFEL